MPYGSYCTQIGPDGQGAMRCGPACVASVLLDDGWQSDPWQLTLQLEAQSDPQGDGTTSADLIRLANANGLDGRLWYGWPEADAALLAGEAVLVLCDNRYLTPRTYPPGASWEALHWVRCVVHSQRDDMLYLYDPLTYGAQLWGPPYQGPVASTVDGCTAAIQATAWPESGVILTSRLGHDLNAR